MSADVREWTVKSMLEWATGYFKQRGVPEPRLSIEWLLAEILQIDRLDLYLKFDRPLAAGELDALRPLVKRRANHEPLQYIIGHTDFLNAKIAVNPQVLVPRIETEQLTEIILDDHAGEQEYNVLDVGTGSGCIAIALKMERHAWHVSAFDISEEALAVARRNAADNKAEISFAVHDLKQGLPEAFSPPYDLIVSNPPYILPAEKQRLANQVADHEPAAALICEDIAQMYESICRLAAQHLVPGGWLYTEINEHRDEQILALFHHENWSTKLLKDYAGKPRFIKAQLQD